MAVGPSFAADGKSTVAVTHLALARSQNSGTALWEFLYTEPLKALFSVQKYLERLLLYGQTNSVSFCYL